MMIRQTIAAGGSSATIRDQFDLEHRVTTGSHPS